MSAMTTLDREIADRRLAEREALVRLVEEVVAGTGRPLIEEMERLVGVAPGAVCRVSQSGDYGRADGGGRKFAFELSLSIRELLPDGQGAEEPDPATAISITAASIEAVASAVAGAVAGELVRQPLRTMRVKRDSEGKLSTVEEVENRAAEPDDDVAAMTPPGIDWRTGDTVARR